jgi:hypothetical protein
VTARVKNRKAYIRKKSIKKHEMFDIYAYVTMLRCWMCVTERLEREKRREHRERSIPILARVPISIKPGNFTCQGFGKYGCLLIMLSLCCCLLLCLSPVSRKRFLCCEP